MLEIETRALPERSANIRRDPLSSVWECQGEGEPAEGWKRRCSAHLAPLNLERDGIGAERPAAPARMESDSASVRESLYAGTDGGTCVPDCR